MPCFSSGETDNFPNSCMWKYQGCYSNLFSNPKLKVGHPILYHNFLNAFIRTHRFCMESTRSLHQGDFLAFVDITDVYLQFPFVKDMSNFFTLLWVSSTFVSLPFCLYSPRLQPLCLACYILRASLLWGHLDDFGIDPNQQCETDGSDFEKGGLDPEPLIG